MKPQTNHKHTRSDFDRDCLPVGESYADHITDPQLEDDNAPLPFNLDGDQLYENLVPEPEPTQKTLQGDQVDDCGFTVTDIPENSQLSAGDVLEHRPYIEPLPDYDENPSEIDPDDDPDYFEKDDCSDLYKF